jgi:hypothetical protein
MDEIPQDMSNNITNQGIIMPEPVYFSDFWQYKTRKALIAPWAFSVINFRINTPVVVVHICSIDPYNLSFPENCPSACSGKGNCTYGKCICWDGYYGIDCSNSAFLKVRLLAVLLICCLHLVICFFSSRVLPGGFLLL